MARPRPPLMRLRLALLAMGGASLVAGLWLGLARMGVALLPSLPPMSVLDHGPLMVSGFLGTVIALERAVAYRRGWAYLAPALNAVGSVVTLTTSSPVGPLLLTLGSLGVLLILVQVLRMDRALHHVVMTLAAGAWVMGNVLLLRGVPVFDLVVWWIAFLVLTIAAERLELTRLLRLGRGPRRAFVGAVLLLLGGAGGSWVFRDLGFRLVGASCLAIAAWLLLFDITRRTVRQQGSVRFIALSLLMGYGWLAVGGALALWRSNPLIGPIYDAILHTIFVGFVFSMIFGHALVIVPAVIGIAVPYRPRFYAHLLLLHGSLLLRVMGDLGGSPTLRASGAWVSVAALVLFLIHTFSSAGGLGRKAPLTGLSGSTADVVLK